MTRKRLLTVGAIGCAICGITALMIVGVVALVFSLTAPLSNTGDMFFTALREGDYNRAYNLTHSDMRARLGSAERLSILAREYRLEPVSWWYWQQSIRNNTGRLEGQMTLENGETRSFRMMLDREADWKIRFLMVDGQAFGP